MPTFSRRAIVGYTWLALSTVATGFISFGVWVHHMFATGLPQLSMTFFSAASLMIVIPSGIQIFAWLATMLHGRPVLKTPFLFVLGFLVVFVLGGLTGVMFAAVPFDWQVTDSYFVVAHFHYVLIGGAVFPIFAGIYYWFPKMTGRMLHERARPGQLLARVRRLQPDVLPDAHLGAARHAAARLHLPGRARLGRLNLISTIGSYVLALGIIVIVANVLWSLRRGVPALSDPWGGNTLEWSTSSPPAHFNFPVLPIVRSADPNWDVEDRREDALRLERGELLLADGHQTLATTVLEGEAEEELHMPSESIWPFLLALSFAVVFFGLLLDLHGVAILGCILVAGSIAGWHRPQPELQEQ